MFRSSAGEKTQSQATTPDLDDSISFSDDANPDVDVVDVDVESVATKKPHFLDYDAIPPPDFIEHFDRAMNFGNSTKSSNTTNHPQNTNNCSGSGSGEQLKMDKKFEKDGEISDYELAASGYTKKEFTQDDNTLNLNISMQSSSACGKPRKHFLDENPIPPDYMINEHQLREHRSLDRNFERHNEQRSALDLHGNLPGFRSSRERYKDVPPMARLPKGLAWTQSFDSRYEGNLNAGNKLDDFEPKVECVYSLLSMLGSNDPLEMAKKFHELSKNPETCNTLRRSGCIPLLVQIIHADGGPDEPRKWAGMALHNVVHSHPDEKSGRREAKVLRLLDQIMDYCNFLRTLLQSGGEAIADDADRHPLAAMSSLMKVSFDEEHRHAMCELGALQAIPSLVHLDHAVHGPKPENQCCNSLRRFALMALTNLTFGDENNKALLCSQKLFMEALVAQLDCAPDDLLQVTASVLRNLSWRADAQMKAVLNEIGTVTALAKAAMKNKCENTLKAILSALWNLSAHCSTNKAEFCAVEGALSFIVRMLTYEGPSKTLKIIENAGGILRNVSSHIAVREDYRQILREHNCLSILLQQLKSESLTVVSNSCGTLWNLSARCPEDQRFLWDNGAVPMLRSLIHSKHAMISEGSACALKNLLNFRPSAQNTNHLDPIARSLNLKKLPTLNVRKQKALEQELGAASKKHSETCDNLDTVNPKDRPTYDATATTGSSGSSSMLHRHRFNLHAGALGSMVMGGGASSSGRLTRSAMLTKSESRDSVFSAKSDGVVYDQLMRSHSASDANRKLHHASSVRPPPSASAVYALPRDVEPAEEQPIDYAQKYTEHISKHGNSREDPENNAATYQETDLDQPTDFSLRYAENQLESDIDLSPPSGQNDNVPQDVNPANAANGPARSKNQTEGSEILLILEDSVKCYQTEDTPYVISNAASVTDLRSVQTSDKNEENDLPTGLENPETPASNAGVGGVGHMPTRKFSRGPHQQPTHNSNPYGSGSYTPEKPVNYCEEGTPGYFSRYESLSSLDESPPQPEHNTTTKERHEGSSVKNTAREEDTAVCVLKPISNDADKSDSPPEPPSSSTLAGAAQPQINSALETPLMFSRRSSMDSLAEEDVGPLDDKSSVVSDFSRLASGVISPSEIPDSPTQSMPQSPRRNSNTSNSQGQVCFSGGASPNVQRTSHNRPGDNTSKRCLRSVFEDDISTFHVENTPAQFSTATSLSNLSMMDEEASSTNLSPPQPQPTAATTTNTISEGEEEEDGNTNNNDDLLLASCINMGMNRAAAPSMYSQHNDNSSSINNPVSGGMMAQDEPKQYYTEDTPALLSKVGSNTNLSAISLGSSNNDAKDDTVYETIGNSVARNHHQSINRRSLNLSDDMSSNASESGAAGIDILQQCIREGMQKSASAKEKPKISETPAASHRSLPPSVNNIDPIAMLRRGGNVLPPYLTGNDEMSKYRVEDSPCNFSVMSGLSNLTVGSSLVGPALLIHGGNSGATSSGNNNNSDNSMAPLNVRTSQNSTKPLLSAVVEDARREPQWQDDSLSSLSIESEDDTNLLSQAIAAGCNRPKSNLGFTTNLTSTGNHKTTPSLSSSQPIPINAATSASSLTSQTTARQFDKPQPQPNGAKQPNYGPILAGNESYSSVDSSDSNDNQSKSLFELCILTGMHKNRDNNLGGGSSSSSRKHTRSSHSHRTHKNGHNDQNTTQSNPNLKQFDSLPMQGKQLTPNRHVRERDRRDEKLLMECINTGIMKKIGESCKQQNPPSLLTREALVLHNNQPKNGQATSAAAQMEELIRPQSAKSMDNSSLSTATSINTTTTITAAPDVEKNDNISNNLQQTITSNIISHDEDINDQRNPFNSEAAQHRNPAVPPDENLPSLASDPEITNGIGCKSDEPEDTQMQSDESNQSFIMETTVSLESRTNDNSPEKPLENEKHKDPDLMLKSVERLTLEFVSSAEQLRTNSTGPAIIHHNFINVTVANDSAGDCTTTTASISNDTWDEDTCPNDVSFPSVSISAPKVISITYDEDDEDQATTADYKELNDFAENTPNIDELPPPDLSLDFDNIGVNQANGNGYNYDSQPSSMDCYTDKTLVNENVSSTKTDNGDDGKKDRKDNPESEMENSSCGLNFKLGGIVQTAAAAPSLCFNVNAMTNSTFIAQEARKLANNLQAPDTDGEEELTFSINSLDLDNIRPPSGMDSLNISGYYQDSHTQPNSLQNSPQMYFKSPKFPRKTLPAGLVARRALGQMPPHLSGSAESVNSSCNLLLDNIKPPSLMDELLDSMISVSSIQSEIADDCASMATTVTVSNYETANGGVTLGCEDGDTITLRSYSEDQLPRDDEQHTYNDGTITPLPSDYDFSSAESTPKKSYSASPSMGLRNLTPKQKRQVVKDRYRTYTIDGEMSEELRRKIEESQKDETLQIEITSYDERNATTSVENGKYDDDDGQKQDSDLQNTPRSRRRSSQERYRTQTISYSDLQAHITQGTNYTDITSNYTFTSDNVATSDNETNTRLDQDLTSLEYDQNSETESCHNFETKPHVLTDCEEEQELEDAEMEIVEKQSVVRPRIVIPGESTAINDESTENGDEEHASPVKTIRGGKKPQYVSPYSMKFQKTIDTSKTTKAQGPTTGTATKPNGQLRKPNGASVASTNTKLAQKKPLKDAAKDKAQDVAAPVPPLERQGTFVKDEPSVDASTVPVVETSPKKSKLSKLPMKRQLSSSSNTSPQKTANTRKLPTSANSSSSSLSATNKRNFGGSITKPQRANSNVNIRVTTNAARIAVLSTRVSTTTPPSRSNSTLNSANAAVTAAQNAAAKINQAQSRIAGIWRRVDEAKNRQQTTTKINNNNTKGSQLSGKTTTTAQAASSPRPGTLVRSTTFDNSPPLTTVVAAKPKAGVGNVAATGPGKSNGGSVASTKIAMAQRQILGIRK
ncbi:LOW QUALITY PROTEIN: adenomatous polyposis coli homolog [Musca domestica]|uniref:LOW QUALITY PROTEIN: adenomatous polyposis coli homolog n=1 Tax=Musca domestica TaxID=7370 RepID=A0ABM3VDT9_MUSDO|nr:LOW QUALITY PROTEIN: adenomatous polyposis coli homolog [Musca domestica]